MAMSMTGYGRAESVTETGRIVVELKSVNNRYCDVQIRMPRAFLSFEPMIKERVSNRLVRGKADVFINVDDTSLSKTDLVCQMDLVEKYSTVMKDIAEATGRPDDVGVSVISRFPDVIKSISAEADTELIKSALFEALDGALDGISLMREAEGERLMADILSKRQTLISLLEQVELRAPIVPQEYRERLTTRIRELLGEQAELFYDESRREAEIALFADRCSVDEEITRLRSHLEQMDATLRSEGSMGKRLDFIIQETNREINTIGSKANDLMMSNLVLDMKTTVEQIREQIQNIV